MDNYHAAFDLFKSGRESAKTTENTVNITVDLQQRMPLSRLSTSKAFYLKQMWMYNLGIHIVAKHAEKLFFAHEQKDHLIIWSDSCVGQNKN